MSPTTARAVSPTSAPGIVDSTSNGAAELAIRAFWPRVAGTAATRITQLVFYVATSILAARLLGPQGLGLLTVMLTLGMLGVQVGNLGLPSAVAYYVATDRNRLAPLIGGSLMCGLGFGSIIAGVLFALFAVLPALAPLSSAPLLAAALAWIPFGLLALLLLNLLLGLERMRSYNGVQIAQSAAALGIIIVLFATGKATVGGFYAASVIPLIAACGVLLVMLKRNATDRIQLPSKALIGSAAGYGFRAYLALLFSFTVLKFDLLMVARMVGEADAGLYAVAASGGELVTLPFAALGTVLFGAVAGSGVRWEFVRRVTLIAAATLLPVLIAAAFLAAPMVRLVLGAEYLSAVPAFLWLLPGLYLLGINTILMHYFAASGMPLVTVISPAIASLLNVLLNLLMLPRLGIIGASIASTVAYATMVLSSLLYLRLRRPR